MDIDFLILADAVQVAEGKLYVMGGGWDQISVNALPAVQMIGVAVAMLVQWTETNTPRSLTLMIDDDDGASVLPAVQVLVDVGRPTDLPSGAEQRIMVAFNAQVALPHLGGYVVIAALDGGGVRRHRFAVRPGPLFRET